MAWPQHYVLVGNRKERPTYDQLKPTQWMAGVIKGALDLSDTERIHKLNYLASLLEDASDFSFENAKACHAVILTDMERDKLTWEDTHLLDRYRRQHAQRHDAPVQRQNFQPKKQQNSENSDSKVIPCKYFNDSQCSKHHTHFTRGIWYLHICSKCKGDHSAKKCPPPSKN